MTATKQHKKVILVGDGIARVYGLRNCMSNELLEFEGGSFGVAQNLEEETVSVAVLSDKELQNKMQTESGKVLDKFRFENIAKGYMAAIEECVKE